MSFHPFSAVRTCEALRVAAISQRDECRYWLFSSLVWLFYIYHAGIFGQRLGWFLLYDVGMALAILWIGLSEAFKANGGEAGTDFLRRVVLIGTPLGAWVLVASEVLGWASWYLFPKVIDHQAFANPARAWEIVTYAVFNGIQIVFWWRLCHHLHRLNKTHE